MRRLIGVFMAFAAMVGGLVVLSPQAAWAADISKDAPWVEKSAGQKWALQAPDGQYVRVEMDETRDEYQWRLRAVSASAAGSWERFTLHSNHPSQDIVSLRSESTGFFVTSEDKDADDRQGMLRARGGHLGNWEQFKARFRTDPNNAAGYLVSFERVEQEKETLTGTGQYVGVDPSDSTLKARYPVPVEFRLHRITSSRNPGQTLPAAGAAAANDLNVMTWNVCGDHNRDCDWSDERAGADEITSAVQERLRVNGTPDVVFFQEFCEKHAKRVEEMLEAQTGRGWDVRFAPIHVRADGVSVQKQCAMGPKPEQLERGAYGVAVAVPDENTFYQRFDLSSPADKEQRTALCATIPSRAVVACTAHLSAGKPYDDLTDDGYWRKVQATELRDLATRWEDKGYRAVFGGDMNLVPPAKNAGVDQGGPSAALVPVYDRYLECEQGDDPAAPRDGRYTANKSDSTGLATRKLDYLFAPKTAAWTSCKVSDSNGKSDHWSLYGTVHLPPQ